MLPKTATISCTRHLQSRSFNGQLSKIKPSFDGYLIENSSPSFNGYKVEDKSSVSTHLFRRQRGDFIVSEVTISPSGTTTSRVRNILKRIKRKWKNSRPSTRKMVKGVIATVLLTITVHYAINYIIKKWVENSLVPHYLSMVHLEICMTPSVFPKRTPIHPNTLVEPVLRAAAPTFDKPVGTGFWARSQCQLMMPQPQLTFCQQVMAEQFVRRQAEKILIGRGGGPVITPEMMMTALALIKSDPAMSWKLQELLGTQVGSGGWASYLGYLSYLSYLPPVVFKVGRRMAVGIVVGGTQSFFYAIGCPVGAQLIGFAAGMQSAGAFSANSGNPNKPVNPQNRGNSDNPGNSKPLGTFENPITRRDQIGQLRMPVNQNDDTPYGGILNGTDILLAVTAKQANRERKHFMHEYNNAAPGQKRLDALAQFILNTSFAENATAHFPLQFNNHYKMVQPAISILFQNATHNFVLTYIFEVGYELLDSNGVLPPEAKAAFKKYVLARFRTAYPMNDNQLRRLIEERKVQ